MNPLNSTLFLCFGCYSSNWLHDKGDRRHLEGKRLEKEYDDFQVEIINTLRLPNTC
jgi:hypothetical protein